MKKYLLRFCLFAAVLLPITLAKAQPAMTFGISEVGGGFDGPDQVQGWQFVPQTDITVTELGLYDGRSGGGFIENHEVAIWDGSGDLLTSAPISSGQSGVLEDQFWFVDVSATTLYAGQTYVVGAFLPSPADDYTLVFTPQNAIANEVTFSPEIQYVGYRFGFSPGGISFPGTLDTTYVGGFGPNFIFSVPEPSVFALLAVMLPMGTLWMRQRKSSGYTS